MNPLESETPASSASTALKESTAEHHVRAERSEFQRRLVGGRIDRSLYTDWLGQMLLVHRALEERVGNGGLGAADAELASRERFRSPDLERDLEHFASADTIAPLPATAAYVDKVRSWAAAELLGALYVFEGSTNGGRYIARNVRRAFSLETAGASFLDPYGERQTSLWQSFKAALDRSITVEQAGPTVSAARDTFDAVAAIGGDLLARHSSPSPAA